MLSCIPIDWNMSNSAQPNQQKKPNQMTANDFMYEVHTMNAKMALNLRVTGVTLAIRNDDVNCQIAGAT